MRFYEAIIQQLGGRGFISMTGAKNFLFDNKTRILRFRLPSRFAKNNINYVKVQIINDVYTVTFSKVWGTKVTEVSKHEQIYCDMIAELFRNETGLETRMPRVIGL